MALSRTPQPVKRKGHWYLERRVPDDYKHIDPRGIVFMSTRIRITDDPRAVIARVVVARLNDELEAFWQQKASKPDPKAAYQNAVRRAASHGKTYQEANIVAELPAADFYGRLDIARDNPTEPTIAAVLGGTPKPEIMVSEMVAEYQAVAAPALKKKSPRQLQKWLVSRNSALAFFQQSIGGDMPLHAINRTHAVKFRDAWAARSVEDNISIATCNRNIGRVSGMFNTLNESLELGLEAHFRKLKIKGAENEQRLAFDPIFIRDVLLKTGLLDDLNPEARRIFYVIVETGARISELCNMDERQIILEHRIPHIRIRSLNAETKTAPSLRDIPLVGVALKAMKLQPQGFPRYFDKADVASATINKFLHERKIIPLDQSLSCLRHSFDDRITSVHAPDKINAALMGHKWHRPKYGRGPSLQEKQEWLTKIAFPAPLTV